MNLIAYDEVIDKIDRQKTWYNYKSSSFISRDISYRKYYTFLKRYNPESKTTSYFIAMLDEKENNIKSNITRKDCYGRVCLRANSIIKDLDLVHYKRDINISLKHIEHTYDGDIYEIIN